MKIVMKYINNLYVNVNWNYRMLNITFVYWCAFTDVRFSFGADKLQQNWAEIVI